MLQHLGVQQTPCEPLRAFFVLVVFFQVASESLFSRLSGKRNRTGSRYRVIEIETYRLASA
jgi:hypothetical protein